MHRYPLVLNFSLKELVSCLHISPSLSCCYFCLGAKSSTGLMEWMNVETALEAFLLANHQQVFSQSKNALQIKVPCVNVNSFS